MYENALAIEFKKSGLDAKPQAPIKVEYDRRIVGEYNIDLLIEDCVIVEIKAVKSLLKEHEAQLLNYLKASRMEVGLLLDFGPKPQITRKIFDNHRK